MIKRDELVRLIISNKRKHQLLSVLSYNIGDINETTISRIYDSFNIEDIEFQETHEALEGTNSLFYI